MDKNKLRIELDSVAIKYGIDLYLHCHLFENDGHVAIGTILSHNFSEIDTPQSLLEDVSNKIVEQIQRVIGHIDDEYAKIDQHKNN